MPHEYEIEFKGAKVKCKSLDAAVKLLRELGQDAGSLELAPWDKAEFTEFVERLELRPRQLLAFLLDVDVPVSDEDLCEVLHLSGNKALAGVLSGVSKIALAFDIKPQRVYRQTTTYEKGKPVREYRVTSAFKEAAVDADWPSERDLEEREK